MAEAKQELTKLTQKDIEKLILDLYKLGNSTAKIGLLLRDQHGILRGKNLGKRIGRVIKDTGENLQEDRAVAQRKMKKLETHASVHKHDYTAKRSIGKQQWILRRLSQEA